MYSILQIKIYPIDKTTTVTFFLKINTLYLMKIL
jgi:hypothetical protein